jgi:excisionase family DNA binding protein
MTRTGVPVDGAEPISVKVSEAVRMTGISRSRLYELMRDGEVEFAKVGSSTLIIVDSLRSFILGRRV